ncbi:hypothetical protein EV193_103349 [Herbihabitans rhizosphaerae]|uniref:Uncharacterized protein n=1 Tax=Herbihabitans rhizosphaerae TaxID=1872711 RepID=A0A4Q7KYB6_9PSEU|nr:hypothetical protein [Herbihabitans rhizosphaerae]RZS41031.1 hypothetical protein EV193_103349 [Herbihabitans rhizosphaerae]
MAIQPVAPDDRVRRDLSQTLRTGPFPAALHLAIEASGLTLDQIQAWLTERGAKVSVPTLSYWRRGRSRPERAGSLRAVHLLEELFELPPDSLVQLLGPRRPRGRWLGHAPGAIDTQSLFDLPRTDLLAGVEASINVLTRMSTHITVTVGADRRTTSIRMRQLVRANVERVSRCTVMYVADDQPAHPPVVADVRFCRLGRVRIDRSVGVIVAELILDRMLGQGEPALLEYEWRFSSGTAMEYYEHRFHEPIREYALQVRFDPSQVPAQCYRYDRTGVAAPEENRRELWIGGSDTALLAEWDLPAGIVGMRWHWPPGFTD